MVHIAAQPRDRIERRIEKLLNDAEAAENANKWQDALDAYNDVLVLEPTHREAIALRTAVQRRISSTAKPATNPRPVQRPVVAAPTSPAQPVFANRTPPTPVVSAPPVVTMGPAWRLAWMSQCGEDSQGRWATATISGVDTRFRYCPAGRFWMGSPPDEVGRTIGEGPRHEVQISQGFWLSDAPVIQRLWEAVSGKNPSHFKGIEQPVESVSWQSCEAWISTANRGNQSLNLRLPSEAEWEYACRACTDGATYRGASDEHAIRTIAWYAHNSSRRTHSVRQKLANAWGLYDMLGNVWEWCADNQRFYGSASVVDPIGGGGLHRVARGGSWRTDSGDIRAARRLVEVPHQAHNGLGLRLVIT